ncbi:cycloartenol synthase-like [Quercus suber]|uniref:cycloartenol synthase-like n=1 Tax=Quercus suber TaxID=58331 RepID=UPI0032DEA253
MWKLKTGAEIVREERNNDDESGGSTGSETWLRTLNGHLGRQVWEFHPELGTPEELQQIKGARRGFYDRRFEKRHSSDLLMRIQAFTSLAVVARNECGEVLKVWTKIHDFCSPTQAEAAAIL